MRFIESANTSKRGLGHVNQSIIF